jgi:LDH2 family malate/lactate/ureidoglycolate dehydrogenase
MAVASIRDWQMVVGGPYVRIAADEGLVGLAGTNFMPLVAPPGGRARVLGTNPIAFGIPARQAPVVLDVATTMLAMQKVRLAAETGSPLPEGVVLDADGRSAVDPAAFFSGGTLAPLGSPLAPHKGFALAMLVEALTGIMSGGRFAGSVEPGPASCFLAALDVTAFLPLDDFVGRVDSLTDQIRLGPLAAGSTEIVVPGQLGDRRRRDLLARGVVPLAEPAWQILTRRCSELDVALPTTGGSPPG